MRTKKQSDMTELWTCPKCKRVFRRANQRHSCGVGDKTLLQRGRSAALVRLYEKLEKVVLGWDDVEIVYRKNYALFRRTRIFADLVMMKDALRLAVHLNREVNEPIFFKTVRNDRGRVSHVAKIYTDEEVKLVLPYLVEAYRTSMEE